MIKETYLAVAKNLPENAVKIYVTATAKNILAPTWELINDWKQNKIDWQEYEVRFRKQKTSNPEAMEELRRITELSKVKDVYLICYEKQYPCHRFILIDMIKEMKKC